MAVGILRSVAADAGPQGLKWYDRHPVAWVSIDAVAAFVGWLVASMVVGLNAGHAVSGAAGFAVVSAFFTYLSVRRRRARARAYADWERGLG